MNADNRFFIHSVLEMQSTPETPFQNVAPPSQPVVVVLAGQPVHIVNKTAQELQDVQAQIKQVIATLKNTK